MASAHQLIGKTLAGRFRITKLIGEGAMATVLHGEQDGDPREVAIKVMRPELGTDPSFPKRFKREAKTAQLLEHPNTVRILDFGADGHTHYIVMELLRGRDLFDCLAVEKRLSEARAARLLIQICDALSAAHGQGIIHRDLKPENVWLEPDPADPAGDRVKVLDFGIAKLLDPEIAASKRDGNAPPSSHLVTMAGTVVGTPEYMSPEQCNGATVGPRSDVYACGVILYQLVTGRAPFVADSPIEVTIMHVHAPPEPPSNLCPGLHQGLEKIILGALAKTPEERTKSAADMRDALKAILPELSTVAKTEAAPPRVVKPASKTVVSPTTHQPPPARPVSPFERTLASEQAPFELPPPPQEAMRADQRLPATVRDPASEGAPLTQAKLRAAPSRGLPIVWPVVIAITLVLAALAFALTR